MRKLLMMVAGLAAVSLVAMPAHGIGVGAKLKSKKVQGDLVPALSPVDTGEGTGDYENVNAAFQDIMQFRSSTCTFTKGKYKIQVGKDAAFQLGGVECGGTPYSGSLCVHVKSLATIMSEDIDKDGNATAKTCDAGIAGNIAGQGNWVTTTIGTISCNAGNCKGTAPTIVSDPCPDVDKINEVRRIEVFDGPDKGELVVLGTTLAACCGPNQTVIGAAPVSGVAPCNAPPGSLQRVLGEAGNVTQGVTP